MTAIEYYRRKKNIKQYEFAEMMGVTQQTMSLWENQHITPTVDRYKQMGKLLSVEWTELTKEI